MGSRAVEDQVANDRSSALQALHGVLWSLPRALYAVYKPRCGQHHYLALEGHQIQNNPHILCASPRRQNTPRSAGKTREEQACQMMTNVVPSNGRASLQGSLRLSRPAPVHKAFASVRAPAEVTKNRRSEASPPLQELPVRQSRGSLECERARVLPSGKSGSEQFVIGLPVGVDGVAGVVEHRAHERHAERRPSRYCNNRVAMDSGSAVWQRNKRLDRSRVRKPPMQLWRPRARKLSSGHRGQWALTNTQQTSSDPKCIKDVRERGQMFNGIR